MVDGHKSLTWRIEKVMIKTGMDALWILFILTKARNLLMIFAIMFHGNIDNLFSEICFIHTLGNKTFLK